MIYKLSASAGLTASYTNVNVMYGTGITDTQLIDSYNGIGTWINQGPSNIETKNRSLYVAGSGCYVQATIDRPAKFAINIPDYGKILDVKVWVEFIHDIRGGRGPITGSAFNHVITNGSGEPSTSASFGAPNIRMGAFKRGLGSVVVALRSPNVKFGYSHPLWNGNFFRNKQWHNITSSNGIPTGLPVDLRPQSVPEIFKNSYLLWSGHTAELDLFDPSITGKNFVGGDGSSGSRK